MLGETGVTVVEDAFPDVRDEALEITRRYWRKPQLTGKEYDEMLWDWDRFHRRMLEAMAETDALLMPATTEPAPAWRESIDTDYVWQLAWSLTGSPAVVVPSGSRDGLPLAVQIVGRPFDDHLVLAIAGALGC
jgi:Asp-tRNA(Asn)/Glu-tRNA(Gln) amidotransferase A subunit family amidase